MLVVNSSLFSSTLKLHLRMRFPDSVLSWKEIHSIVLNFYISKMFSQNANLCKSNCGLKSHELEILLYSAAINTSNKTN